MFVSAANRAPETPCNEMAPPGETEYCDTILPTSNVLAPASDTQMETGAPGRTEFNRSAQRPPQPVVGGWLGTEVCHCVTWSAWEKSCGGFSRTPARYCARLMGKTSVPVLNRTAAFFSPNRVRSSGQAGCSP